MSPLLLVVGSLGNLTSLIVLARLSRKVLYSRRLVVISSLSIHEICCSYCDEHICPSVCLYLREHSSETSSNLCMLPMAVAQSSSRLAALRYVMCFQFRNDVIFSHDGQYVDTVAASDIVASSCAG